MNIVHCSMNMTSIIIFVIELRIDTCHIQNINCDLILLIMNNLIFKMIKNSKLVCEVNNYD